MRGRIERCAARHGSSSAQWLLKLVGWGLTGAALVFGAPFWFDALGKLARVRNTGDKPTSST